MSRTVESRTTDNNVNKECVCIHGVRECVCGVAYGDVACVVWDIPAVFVLCRCLRVFCAEGCVIWSVWRTTWYGVQGWVWGVWNVCMMHSVW